LARVAASAAELPTPEQIRELSGLEFMQSVLAGRFPAPPICATLDFALTLVAEGHVEFTGRPGFAAYNPLGAVHGGWFGTLLDSCMACAVMTRLPRGQGYTTLEYKVNVVRPLFEHSGEVRAVGRALHVGGRTGVAEGRLVGAGDGKLYALGTTTCLVFPL